MIRSNVCKYVEKSLLTYDKRFAHKFICAKNQWANKDNNNNNNFNCISWTLFLCLGVLVYLRSIIRSNIDGFLCVLTFTSWLYGALCFYVSHFTSDLSHSMIDCPVSLPNHMIRSTILLLILPFYFYNFFRFYFFSFNSLLLCHTHWLYNGYIYAGLEYSEQVNDFINWCIYLKQIPQRQINLSNLIECCQQGFIRCNATKPIYFRFQQTLLQKN